MFNLKEIRKIIFMLCVMLFSTSIYANEITEKQNTPATEKVETSQVKPVMIEPEKGIKFLNNTLFAYGDETLKNKIDTIRKGSKIEVVDFKKVVQNNKEKFILKIKYRKNLKNKEAWINDVKLANNLNETLPKKIKNLDFETKFNKNNFENNPRVEVKGIFVSIHTLSNKEKMQRLIQLAKDTEINTFVIDVKEDTGVLSFKMEAPEKFNIKTNKNFVIKDIKEFIKEMKENGIYTIARVVAFKDAKYAKSNPEKVIVRKSNGKPYTNKDGLIWVSAYDRNLWEYNLAVAEEAAKAGFNEIQFDYMRFPASNGGKLDSRLDYKNMKNESKPEAIQKFLKLARKRLNALNVYVSADVYGQIGTFYDDMGLGQHWEAVSSVTDYISPMMYPSHYIKNAYGVPVPDAEPYKIIYHSTLDSINRNENIEMPAEIRPWIQAFTAKWVKNHINYNEKEIREQIKALKDLGINEYLLWNASNNYKFTK